MISKRILNFLAASLIAVSCTMGVSAQGEKFTTDAGKPAISFDGDNWKKYVVLTKDAKSANLKISSSTTKSYQALSLQIKGSLKNSINAQHFPCSKYVKGQNGKKLYPLAGVDGTQPVTIGVEINAKKFGLKSFDGCTINFKYRFDESVNGKLLQNSAFVYPADENDRVLTSNPLQLVYNSTNKDNVGQYNKAALKVKSKAGASKIVFDIPVSEPLTENVLFYLDNIVIKTASKKNGKALYVANVDDYNDGAKPAEIKKADNSGKNSDSSTVYGNTSTKSDKTNPLLIAGGIIVGVAVVAGVVIFIIKQKQKFY